MPKKKALPHGYYWRGGTIWVRTDPVTKQRRSTGCTDIAAAQQWRAERERVAVNPVHAAAEKATVGSWITRTLQAKHKARSEGTYDMYSVKLGHVARIFGARASVATIDAAAVDRYIEQRQSEGAKNNTISRELSCLMQMLKLARRAGEYHLDPAAVKPVGFSAEYVPVKRILLPDDLAKLFEVLTEEQCAWVAFALATGGDIVDVEHARLEDYDAGRGTIHLRGTKTVTRDRDIPILPQFEDLFHGALPHLPLSWPRVSKALPEACAKAGIPHISPKDLRRTAATWLLAWGASRENVAKFLGHRDTTMVHLVYGQLSGEELGRLLQDQTVQDRHSYFEAPWRKGRRGGFKRRSKGLQRGVDGEEPPAKAAKRRRTAWGERTDSSQLIGQNAARVRRLAALASLDDTAKPGLALCRALDAAYAAGDGDAAAVDEMQAHLSQAAGGDHA